MSTLHQIEVADAEIGWTPRETEWAKRAFEKRKGKDLATRVTSLQIAVQELAKATAASTKLNDEWWEMINFRRDKHAKDRVFYLANVESMKEAERKNRELEKPFWHKRVAMTELICALRAMPDVRDYIRCVTADYRHLYGGPAPPLIPAAVNGARAADPSRTTHPTVSSPSSLAKTTPSASYKRTASSSLEDMVSTSAYPPSDIEDHD